MTSGAIALPDGGIDIAAAGFGIEGGRITSNAWVRIVVPDCMAGFNDCCIGNKTFMTLGAVDVPDGGIDIAAGTAVCIAVPDRIAAFDNCCIGNNLGQREQDPHGSVPFSSSAPKFISSSEAAGKRRCNGYSWKCWLM